jgi:hypothetical protein
MSDLDQINVAFSPCKKCFPLLSADQKTNPKPEINKSNRLTRATARNRPCGVIFKGGDGSALNDG